MSRWAVAVLLVSAVTACSSPAAVVTPTPTEAPTGVGTIEPSAASAPVAVAPSKAAEAPVTIAGNTKTGVSPKFKLAGGSYTVEWSTTADTAGCDFSLFLATKVNGPTVKDIPASIMPEAKDYSGTTEWTGVKAGAYVLQEDRSGMLNCAGPWNATLTPH